MLIIRDFVLKNYPHYGGILRLLIAGAENGDAEAYYLLGYMNFVHPGVPEEIWNQCWIYAATHPDLVSLKKETLTDAEISVWLAFTPEHALSLYNLAAGKGYGAAYLELAKLKFYGLIMPKDIPGAIKLYELAARAGNAKAIVILANFYFLGEHVERDLVKACACLAIASGMGIAHARPLLKYFTSQLSAEEIPKVGPLQKQLYDEWVVF